MDHQYCATVYYSELEKISKTGDNMEELYIWMMGQVNGAAGDIHGTIIDNKTKEIVRRFRRDPIE